MQRKLLLLQMVLLLFAYVNSNAQDFGARASITAKQARSLATEQLPTVLQWMEPEDLSLYGFSLKDDFGKITVGRPFYLATIEDVRQMNLESRRSMQVRSMILPLILENSVRCFIYISYEDNKWKAVGIGSREFALKGGSIFNKSDDNASLIVSIDQLNEEFIADNTKGVSLYRPIFRTNKKLVKDGYSINELMALFTESVKKADNF